MMNTQNAVPDNAICLPQDVLGRIPCALPASLECSFPPEDGAALFNELAISCFAKGNYLEAERCLEAALMAGPQQPGSATIKARRPPKPVPDSSCAATAANIDATAVTAGSCTPSDPRSLYIFQRELYDEGMRRYQQPLSLHSAANPGCSNDQATLWYNLGQTKIQLFKVQEACHAFGSAQQALGQQQANPATSSNSSSTSYLHYLILHNLGYCCYRMGDNERALQHMEQALAQVQTQMQDTTGVSTKTSNSHMSSFDLAASCNCVAVLFFHAFGGRSDGLDKALELFQVALEHYICCVGERSTEVATVRSNMGRIYFLLPDYAKGMECFTTALAIRTALLGPRALDVMTCLFNIAGTFHKQHQLDQAKDYYQRFVHLAVVQFQGAAHRDYAAALLALADIASEQGHLPRAATLIDQALSCARAALGARHPDMVLFLSRHGNLAFARKQYDQALQSYQECLVTQQCFLPSSNPSIMVTLLNIARISKQCGRYRDAFLRYAEIYTIQLNVLGPNHPETASTIFNMGLMKYICDDHQAALSYYQEALRLRRDLSESSEATNEHHLDTAAVLNSIGLSLFKLNHLALAKEAFCECLRIRREIHGPVHREIATMLYNLATIHMDMGEDDRALQLYRQSLSIEKQALGDQHPDVSLTLQHLAGMHQERGELEEALSYFQQALVIERFHATATTATAKNDGDSHDHKHQPAVCKLLNVIGNIHLMMARVDAMMECYQESCRLGGQDGLGLVIAGLNFYGLSKLHPPCAPIA